MSIRRIRLFRRNVKVQPQKVTKHAYLYFKGSPYGAAPLITPFCIPEKVDFLGKKLVIYLNFV